MATQKEIDIAFQQIVSSASDLDMVLPKPPKAADEKLSPKEQQKMLAVFARYISEGHPGFAPEAFESITFSDAVKNKFKTEFVKLYLSCKDECNLTDMGKKLFLFAKKHLPDNHFNVYDSQGTPIGMTLSKQDHAAFKKELTTYLQQQNIDSSQRGILEHFYSKRRQVGKNLFYDEEFELLQQNGAKILSDKQGKTWRMTKINHHGQNLMIIGMKRFDAIAANGQLNKDLIKDYTALAKEFSKQEHTLCDALILDLRGNLGGWPYIGDYIARTLYGNTVSTEPQRHLKMDTLAAKLIYAFMVQEDYNSYPNKQARLRLMHERQNTQYTQTDTPWAEAHPFNPKLGYQKPILVLTDQSTGSNAEQTIGRLREHPFVRTLGEHSYGVVQYHPAATPTTAIPLPYGLKISVPPEGFSGPNGEKLEGIGYQPDYPTPKGQDALLAGLENFAKITQEILQHLPPEQAVTSQAKREAKIDETTNRNLHSISSDNPELRTAFNELVETTAVIPQLKTPATHIKSKDHQS